MRMLRGRSKRETNKLTLRHKALASALKSESNQLQRLRKTKTVSFP